MVKMRVAGGVDDIRCMGDESSALVSSQIRIMMVSAAGLECCGGAAICRKCDGVHFWAPKKAVEGETGGPRVWLKPV